MKRKTQKTQRKPEAGAESVDTNFVQPIKDISQFHDFSIPKNGEIACRYFFDSSHVLVQKFVKL